MNLIKRTLRRLLLGCRADSDSYIAHLRRRGMRIGEGTVIFSPRRVLIDETRPWMIQIGRHVQITHGVTILTHGYDWSVLQGAYGQILGSCGKVTNGANVFLGMNTTIVKGLTIGSNVIIGAGSVVTGDIPDNTVAAGNPARVIMTLEQYRQKREQAQRREARQLVREFRRVYGRDPGEEQLREFFTLFCDDPDGLPPCWEAMLHLSGDYPGCAGALCRNQKQFASMEAFLEACE